MKIVFDGQAFAIQRYGGISRAVAEVAPRVGVLAGCPAEIWAPVHVNRYPLRPGAVLVGRRIPWLPRTTVWRLQWNARRMDRIAATRGAPDVLHKTYFYQPDWAPPKTRVVVTVYDMTFEKCPGAVHDVSNLTELKAACVRRADRVVCISESTRRDVVERLGVSGEKTVVVPLAASLPPPGPRPTDPPSPYILHVGHRGSYKNFRTLLDSYASSPRLKKDFALLCFGGEPLMGEEGRRVRAVRESGGRVLFRSGDDAALSRAYADASAFVFPSQYEGFGIPLLEAMSAGCPVVSSTGGSLPEVAGEAALLFPPEDTEALRARLEEVLYAPDVAGRLRDFGRRRAADFSWDRTAEKTWDVYRGLA